MALKHVMPKYQGQSFVCPHCGVTAQQAWGELHLYSYPARNLTPEGDWFSARCHACTRFSLWQSGNMVWPDTSLAAPPNEDMPEAIRTDFEEARSIVGKSPRAAAALLRLCMQKLCRELGEPGDHLDTDIKSLVARGLSAKLQKALDAVRVIGNESVHPGKMDMKDDQLTALALFDLVNLVVNEMISEPKHVDDVYNKLTESVRQRIERRDA